MLNNTSCSAETLEQLTPTAIRSVVEAATFEVGVQYFSENRVHILSSDKASILSEVKGLQAVYKQSIALQRGKLSTSCSCTSDEQPFCRHCTAVLLQSHSEWLARTKPAEEEVKVLPADPAFALSATLREFCTFIEWLNLASNELRLGKPLPDPPSLDSPELQQCFKVIRELQQRMIRSDEQCATLEDELAARDKQIEHLTVQLQTAVAEKTATRTTSEEIQRALEMNRKQISGMEDNRLQLNTKLVDFADALSTKGLELVQFAAIVKELAGAFKTSPLADSDAAAADRPAE